MSMQRRDLEAIKSLFGYLVVGEGTEVYSRILDDGIRHPAIHIRREPFAYIGEHDKQLFKVVVDFDLVNELLEEEDE